MDTLIKQTVFERGDRVYIVSPVSPFDPSDAQMEEFAFTKELKAQAPNPAIKWLQGQYVEAEAKNKNGQVWASEELAIKSLTPMMMPVTVMHDKATAVGVIADTKLLVPERDGVPRARIDNTLAIWAHRFEDVAAEIDRNYRDGTLMQSMECVSPFYNCAECGQLFHKLPGGAERANWCSHLEEGAGFGARILGNVVFTGTGLIFGTRGKEGANPNAHLEVFQDEVAAFHEEVHRDAGRPRKKQKRQERPRRTSMSEIDIRAEEYAELKGRPTRDELAAAEKRATEAEEAAATARKAVEDAETAQKKAETERDEKAAALKKLEEESAEVKLRDERFEGLGDGFLAKLGEVTKTNMREDAAKMDGDGWEKRLAELEELSGVKRDTKLDPSKKPAAAKKEPNDAGGGGGGSEEAEFSIDEIAESVAGGGGGEDGLASDGTRKSLARGLVGSPSKD
jgi:hypothetical protein